MGISQQKISGTSLTKGYGENEKYFQWILSSILGGGRCWHIPGNRRVYLWRKIVLSNRIFLVISEGAKNYEWKGSLMGNYQDKGV